MKSNNESDIEEWLFDIEDNSIDQKIVKRFLFDKIRNHKSRFGFA